MLTKNYCNDSLISITPEHFEFQLAKNNITFNDICIIPDLCLNFLISLYF